jgi:hypothetical protein
VGAVGAAWIGHAMGWVAVLPSLLSLLATPWFFSFFQLPKSSVFGLHKFFAICLL